MCTERLVLCACGAAGHLGRGSVAFGRWPGTAGLSGFGVTACVAFRLCVCLSWNCSARALYLGAGGVALVGICGTCVAIA